MMGWSNYIVLPKYKVVFRVSRNVTADTVNDDAVTLFGAMKQLSEDVDIDVPLKDLSTKTVVKLMGIHNLLMSFGSDDLFFSKLKSYDDSATIVSEMDLEKEEYKDYTKIKGD
jgi:hypothetical protein